MVNNFSKLFLAAEILGQAVGTAADLMTLHQYGFADIRVYQKNCSRTRILAKKDKINDKNFAIYLVLNLFYFGFIVSFQ